MDDLFIPCQLRHLVRHLDGTTTGPCTYSGEIGKQLENCEKMPVVSFEPISSNMPHMEPNLDLSTDQKYLHDIVNSVNTGFVSYALEQKNPGKISHARWLTTVNRILRLYVATEHPFGPLKTLATYIMKVYAPMWFIIKMNPSFIEGLKHLFA